MNKERTTLWSQIRRNPFLVLGGLVPFLALLVLAASLSLLGACSGAAAGSASSTADVISAATPTVATVPQTTAKATATPTARAVPTPTTSSTGPSDSDLLAQGKLIFEKTAGGVGCATCHGLDGKGKSAPYNRGASETRVREVLAGSAMNFIKLNDEEIKAVVAYLQWLATQP